LIMAAGRFGRNLRIAVQTCILIDGVNDCRWTNFGDGFVNDTLRYLCSFHVRAELPLFVQLPSADVQEVHDPPLRQPAEQHVQRAHPQRAQHAIPNHQVELLCFPRPRMRR
jgi:hypothetical protein